MLNTKYSFFFENIVNLMYIPNNCIWSGSGNLSLLGPKYAWLGVNVLNLFKGSIDKRFFTRNLSI